MHFFWENHTGIVQEIVSIGKLDCQSLIVIFLGSHKYFYPKTYNIHNIRHLYQS